MYRIKRRQASNVKRRIDEVDFHTRAYHETIITTTYQLQFVIKKVDDDLLLSRVKYF